MEKKVDLIKIRDRILLEVRQHFTYYQDAICPGTSVLDIGTGIGFTAEYISQQVPNVTVVGLDVTDHGAYPKGISRLLYDGLQMPFLDKSFDTALLFYTLHHAQKPEAVLTEACRVIRNNLIVIEEFEDLHANHEEEMVREKQAYHALGLEENLYHNNLSRDYFNSLVANGKFNLIRTTRLPTKTIKKLEKHLYILGIK